MALMTRVKASLVVELSLPQIEERYADAGVTEIPKRMMADAVGGSCASGRRRCWGNVLDGAVHFPRCASE